MKRVFFFISLIILLSGTVLASINISSEITLMNSANFNTGEDPSYTQIGNALVTLSSSGYKNIKTDIAVNAGFSSTEATPTASLDRITIKAKFPSFRLLMGKTRLDWGEGELFNAGNVLFEDATKSAPIINDALVLQRKWLTSITYPLSSFSFIEGALIVPTTNKAADVKGGLRYYNSERDIKIETGAAANQDKVTPYVSISGSIGIESALSASISIPFDGDEETRNESLTFSASVFHIFSFLNQDTLSLRGEALYTPFTASWLFFYPSVQYQFSNGISLSLKSIVSILNESASISGGLGWNIFEGLVMSSYINTNNILSSNELISVSFTLSSLF